jgi:serine/threonine protein phosphatase 1
MTKTLTYAVGDIHGSFTKVANLIRHCTEHCGGDNFRFVFLGDYVDRGRRSKDVVNLLMRTQAAAPDTVVCLKGNHEDMLLDAIKTGEPRTWIENGGDATLRSYGVSRAEDIPADHLSRFERLPLAISDEKRFFVHAGIMPGVPLQQQEKDVLLWIRGKFLSDQRDHGRYIVHGHTPTENGMPELCHNRLNLDARAWSGNPLFAAVFDNERVGPITFLSDDGRIAPAPPINELERERYASGNRARGR